MTIQKNECIGEPVCFFLGRASVFNEGILRNNFMDSEYLRKGALF